MKIYVIAAALLIMAGLFGLVYGQFSYTKESQGAKLGPIELTITEKQTVNIPAWVGGGALIVGAGMLLFPFVKR